MEIWQVKESEIVLTCGALPWSPPLEDSTEEFNFLGTGLLVLLVFPLEVLFLLLTAFPLRPWTDKPEALGTEPFSLLDISLKLLSQYLYSIRDYTKLNYKLRS